MNLPKPQESETVLPKVASYSIGRDRVAVECPYCRALHFHCEGPGVRATHCALLEDEKSRHYCLLPSTPAPDWIIEWLHGKWRSPVADALIKFRGPRAHYTRREQVLDILATALRDFPDFAERVSIRIVDGGMGQKAAEYAEIEDLLASTGCVELADAALVILRQKL